MIVDVKAQDVLVGDYVRHDDVFYRVVNSYPLDYNGWLLGFGGDVQSLELDSEGSVAVLRDETPKANADTKALDDIAAIIREPVDLALPSKLGRIRRIVNDVRPQRPRLDPDKVLVDVDAGGRIVSVAGEPAGKGVVAQLPLSTLRTIRGEGRYLTWHMSEEPPRELVRELDTWSRP